jgi:hypothetical protein
LDVAARAGTVDSRVESAKLIRGFAPLGSWSRLAFRGRAHRDPIAHKTNQNHVRGITRRRACIQVDVDRRGTIALEEGLKGTDREPHAWLVKQPARLARLGEHRESVRSWRNDEIGAVEAPIAVGGLVRSRSVEKKRDALDANPEGQMVVEAHFHRVGSRGGEMGRGTVRHARRHGDAQESEDRYSSNRMPHGPRS